MSQLQPRQGIPLRADPTAARDAQVASLTRACIATGLATLDRARPSEIARSRGWGEDKVVDLVIRAATAPATIAATPALAQLATAFLSILTPASAGADLLGRGITLAFDGAAYISVPSLVLPTASFVAEGAPIPVAQGTSAAPTLSPHKLALIVSLSRELMSGANAETLVKQALIESCGPGLDAVLFGSGAASALAPAGLLYNIPPLAPTAASAGNKSEIIVDDLQKLGAAVAPVAGNGQIVLIASPDAAVALVLRLPQNVEWPVLTSASLAPRTVIAVAANGIVSASDGAPIVDASLQASLHRDSTPGELVDIGGTLARPIGSMFQSDCAALKMRWPISWALRSPNALAWMQGVNW